MVGNDLPYPFTINIDSISWQGYFFRKIVVKLIANLVQNFYICSMNINHLHKVKEMLRKERIDTLGGFGAKITKATPKPVYKRNTKHKDTDGTNNKRHFDID